MNITTTNVTFILLNHIHCVDKGHSVVLLFTLSLLALLTYEHPALLRCVCVYVHVCGSGNPYALCTDV